MKVHTRYEDAFDDARQAADQMGCDVGIVAVRYPDGFKTIILPPVNNRTGHELRCEVVRPGTPRMVVVLK